MDGDLDALYWIDFHAGIETMVAFSDTRPNYDPQIWPLVQDQVNIENQL